MKKKFKNFTAFRIIGISIILSFSLWRYLNSIGGQNPAFFLLPTRLWQFGLGAFLAVLHFGVVRKEIHTKIGKVLFSLSIALILFGLLGKIDTESRMISVTIGAVGFIVFSKDNHSLMSRAFRTQPVVFLGKISYSLYLYHWPISVSLTYYFIESTPIFWSLFGVGISVLLGWISYSFIENRFRYFVSFKATLTFLLFCCLSSLVVFLLNSADGEDSFSEVISKANGTHYRCEISSYISYGAHVRALLIRKKTQKIKSFCLVILTQMYVPLVSEVLSNDSNLLLLPLNECLPTTLINVSKECLHLANKNLSSVLKDEKVTTIAIATTWYAQGYIDTNGLSVSRNNLKFAVEDLINNIQNSGKSVILFSPIPIPKKNYTSELARKLKFNKITEQEVSEIIKVPRATFEQDLSDVNDHL